ncbi:two-component system, OmpR family, sensor kinase [Actinomadura madurae]|uniref:histidine kinase n=1 Tax=Actinomadura madurae TaxID=1993 RepID=A0A1I5JK43_9ACTN|nr:HAMP domain-containing sensor histidine kinase [Actinomadura madurae]SFO73168.1 two-component system, OmpR family, sensor kinase [Actinomadura madurae]
MIRRRARPRSLRAQLTTANVLLFAVGLALFCVAGLEGLDRFLVNAVDDSLRDARRAVAGMNADMAAIQRYAGLGVAGGAAPAATPATERDLVLIPLSRSGRALALGRSQSPDERQRALARALGGPSRHADGAPRTVRSEGTAYRVTTVRLSDGTYVLLALSLEPVERTVRRLLLLNACAGGVLLLVLAAVSQAESRRRLRPLGDMVQTASAIAEGDLARRVTVRSPASAEVAELRGALNTMLHQIEAAFEMRERSGAQLRRFVADASHELRTPLAAIRGYLQLSGKGMLDGREHDRAVARMAAEADRMARLVDDLLALARLDQHPEMHPVPVDLNRVVRDAAADLRAVQPARPLRVDVPEQDLTTEGDEGLLAQIVANLLANVRAHTPPDAAVQITLRPEADQAVLEVADDGPGMDTGDAAHVFDRFFRARRNEQRDDKGPVSRERVDAHNGSGLGMAIVRAAVEAHGGTVNVDTAPGEGFTATVRLPLSRPVGE